MVAMLRILKALDSKISSSLDLADLLGGKLGMDGITSNASICSTSCLNTLVSVILDPDCYDEFNIQTRLKLQSSKLKLSSHVEVMKCILNPYDYFPVVSSNKNELILDYQQKVVNDSPRFILDFESHSMQSI